MASILLIGMVHGVFAETFRIDSVIQTNNMVQVMYQSRSDSHYFLLANSSLLSGATPVAAVLGTNINQTLGVPMEQGATRFFRVERVLNTSTNDEDHDGIPDTWELQHGLNPLDSLDVGQTKPGDTRTWLQVYLDELPVSASFSMENSIGLDDGGLLGIPVNFNKSFNGNLRIQVGGTALFRTDFTMPGSELVSTTPLIVDVPASGMIALVPVNPTTTPFLQPDRTVTFSLVAPTNGAYQLAVDGPVTHLLTLTESPLGTGGLLAGTLVATNNVFIEPQPLRVAIRTDRGGQLTAQFDTSRAPFFNGPFTLSVQQTANGLQFTGETTGTLPTTGAPAGQTAHWTLSLPQSSTDTNGVITAQFQLGLRGLTASGRTNLAGGTITFAPLN